MGALPPAPNRKQQTARASGVYGAKLNAKEGKFLIFNPSKASHPTGVLPVDKHRPPGTGDIHLHVRQNRTSADFTLKLTANAIGG